MFGRFFKHLVDFANVLVGIFKNSFHDITISYLFLKTQFKNVFSIDVFIWNRPVYEASRTIKLTKRKSLLLYQIVSVHH